MARALGDNSLVRRNEPAEESFENRVAELQQLGLMITAQKRKIAAAVSEAPYFMFADRKEHRPRVAVRAEPPQCEEDYCRNWTTAGAK